MYLLHLMLLLLVMLAEKVQHAVGAAAIGGDLEEVERLFLLAMQRKTHLEKPNQTHSARIFSEQFSNRVECVACACHR